MGLIINQIGTNLVVSLPAQYDQYYTQHGDTNMQLFLVSQRRGGWKPVLQDGAFSIVLPV